MPHKSAEQRFLHAPFGYAYHKMVTDKNGKPVDYIFLEVNKAFELITGLKSENIINKKITEVFPDTLKETFQWIKMYGEITQKKESREFENYAGALNIWFRVYAFSSDGEHFTTFFTDVSQKHLLAKASKELINFTSETVDYKMMTDYMLSISGATYVALNVFESNGKEFVTAAISGINKNLEKASKFLGFKITGKKWAHDPHRERKTRDRKTTVFKNITELTGSVFPERINKILVSTFNLGETVVVKTIKDNELVGDFTMIFTGNKHLSDPLIVETFADLCGAALARIEAEDKIKRSEAKFYTVFQTSPFAKVITRLADGEIMDVNKAFTQITEYSHQEALGQTTVSLGIWGNNEERQELLNLLMKGVSVNNKEISFISKGGKQIIALLSSQIVEINKEKVILTNINNITQQKQAQEALAKSEAKYRYITENISDVIFTADLNFNVLYISSSIEKMIGEPAHIHIKRPLNERYTPSSIEKIHTVFAEEMANEKDPAVDKNRSRVIELEYYKADGSIIHVSTNISFMRNAAGEPIGFQGVSRDITEQKKNEQLIGIRLKLIDYAKTHNIDVLLQKALDEACSLLNSPIGFYHFVSEDQKSLTLQEWSTATKDVFCKAPGKGMHYPIEKAGVWVDCIKTGKPVVHNDYKSLPHKKGLPDGHAEVIREVVLPISRNNRIVAIMGLGNKSTEYTESDVNLASFIADISYDIIEDKRKQKELADYSKMQAILVNISSTYINCNIDDVETVINTSLKEIGQFVQADRVFIFDYDWHKRICTNVYEWCAPGISKQKQNGQNIPMDTMRYVVDLHKKGESHILTDATALSENDPMKDFFLKRQLKSGIALPMMDKGTCVGFVGFDAVTDFKTFTEREQQLLMVFAEMLLNFKNRLDAQRIIKKQVTTQKLLSEISSDFISASRFNIDKKIDNLLKKCGTLLNVDRTFLFQLSTDGRFMSNTHEWCAPKITAVKDSVQNYSVADVPWIAEIVKKKDMFFVPDVEALPDSPDKNELIRQKIKSGLGIPLVNNNKLIGYFGFCTVKEKRPLDEQQIEMLSIFGHILTDALVRHGIEKDLIEAKEIAQKANKAKSDFLFNMSHELRTPLNSIIGFSNLMEYADLNNINKNYVKYIQNSSRSLLSIINDILDTTRFETGKFSLEYTETDMFALINRVVDIIKLNLRNKEVELLLNFPEGIPRKVTVDETRLSQVLINIASNAVKFTEKGEIELAVSFKKLSGAYGAYTFTVRDTGIGISKDAQKLIFDTFYQADSGSTRMYGGVGLGLSISSNIVNNMGSRIKLKSAKGKGSTFYFTLKLKIEEEVATTAPAIKENLNVLIVDDNKNNSKIISNLLSHYNISSSQASGVSEAMAYYTAADHFYDVIIIDYGLRNKKGTELVKKIKAHSRYSKKKTVFIIMHNIGEEKEIVEMAASLKPFFLIGKPVKNDMLLKFLNNLDMAYKDFFVEEKSKLEFELFYDGTPKILIVEDVELNRKVIRDSIERNISGAIIYEAENGEIGVSLFKKNKPDLVFMDVQMQIMDGYEATMAIRKLEKTTGKRTPIIALTAHASKANKEKCYNAGMDDYVSKPFEITDINNIVEKYLSQNVEKVYKKKSSLNHEHFNVNDFISRIGNDKKLAEELFDLFFEGAENYLKGIYKALKESDAKELARNAHSLKGSARTLSFYNLADYVSELEKTDINEKKRIGELISKIEDEINTVKALTQQYLDNNK